MDEKQLADRLRAIREERDLSQNELARRSGISQAAVSKIEAGKLQSPSIWLIRALEKGLGDPPVRLVTDYIDVLGPEAHESLIRFLESPLGQTLALSVEEISELEELQWFTVNDKVPDLQDWYDFVRLRRNLRQRHDVSKNQ